MVSILVLSLSGRRSFARRSSHWHHARVISAGLEIDRWIPVAMEKALASANADSAMMPVVLIETARNACDSVSGCEREQDWRDR